VARRNSRLRTLWRACLGIAVTGFACLSYSWLMLPDVRPLRTEVPERTAFMELRLREAQRAEGSVRQARRWVPYGRISQNLKRAVLVTEDAAFWDHDGVDLNELRASVEKQWAEGGEFRGASTITQQLAKNLYLSPSRNPYRKVVELMITRRLEAELSKARIFELYLNLVEWGDGIWGAEAAARAYFGHSASELSASESALLAGALINPRVYSPARPNARLLARQRLILRRMGTVAPPASPPPMPNVGEYDLPAGAVLPAPPAAAVPEPDPSLPAPASPLPE
jgi:monofunctional biosynthetic peptidoglycan transglycosylase